MSAALQENPNSNENAGVTAISANARIDYILRFSKQAILLIDEEAEIASNVCRQFLGTLPSEHNAAYIAISSKLNDIQIRCRIIEQLYSNTLFDPEQSLAVSIINLAKADNKTLSIVVDNMQYASLQILHELTQLAVIAKKSQANINVVMSGSILSGQLAAQNASLFNNNLSLLAAQTGQLVPLHSAMLKETKNFTLSTPVKIISGAFIFLTFAATMTYMNFDRIKVFNFSDMALLSSKAPKSTIVGEPNLRLQNTNNINSDKQSEQALTTNATSSNTVESAIELQATPQEIVAFIENSPQAAVDLKPIDNTPITPSDIFSAITNASASTVETGESSENVNKLSRDPNTQLNAKPVTSTTDSISSLPNSARQVTTIDDDKSLATVINSGSLVLTGITNTYYQNVLAEYKNAYVVQYAGFTEQKALDEFMLAYRELDYQGYQRLLNNKEMLMLTSPSFESATEATAYLSTLPESLKATGVFIKSVNAINTEISVFESSQ